VVDYGIVGSRSRAVSSGGQGLSPATPEFKAVFDRKFLVEEDGTAFDL
jgi:hypothetical protein